MESKRPSCSCESLKSFHWLNRKSEGAGSGPLMVLREYGCVSLAATVSIAGSRRRPDVRRIPGPTAAFKGKTKHKVGMRDSDWSTLQTLGSNHVTAELSSTKCSSVSHSGLIRTKSSTHGGENVAEVVEIKSEEGSHLRVFPLLLGPGDSKKRIDTSEHGTAPAFLSWGIF